LDTVASLGAGNPVEGGGNIQQSTADFKVNAVENGVSGES